MYFLYSGIILITIVLDQVSKLIVTNNMTLYENIPLIKNFFELTYVQNTGAAFGMLSNQPWIFIVSTIVILIIILIMLLRNKFNHVLTRIACCFIIGGGVGNLIDRVFNGFVVDFIDFKAIYLVCPAVFNFADTFVFVGAVLFAISFIWLEKTDDNKEAKIEKI